MIQQSGNRCSGERERLGRHEGMADRIAIVIDDDDLNIMTTDRIPLSESGVATMNEEAAKKSLIGQ